MGNKEQFLKEMCDIFDKYDVRIGDILALVCCQLDYNKEEAFCTGIYIGDKLYDIEIKRRNVQ